MYTQIRYICGTLRVALHFQHQHFYYINVTTNHRLGDLCLRARFTVRLFALGANVK